MSQVRETEPPVVVYPAAQPHMQDHMQYLRLASMLARVEAKVDVLVGAQAAVASPAVAGAAFVFKGPEPCKMGVGVEYLEFFKDSLECLVRKVERLETALLAVPAKLAVVDSTVPECAALLPEDPPGALHPLVDVVLALPTPEAVLKTFVPAVYAIDQATVRQAVVDTLVDMAWEVVEVLPKTPETVVDMPLDDVVVLPKTPATVVETSVLVVKGKSACRRQLKFEGAVATKPCAESLNLPVVPEFNHQKLKECLSLESSQQRLKKLEVSIAQLEINAKPVQSGVVDSGPDTVCVKGVDKTCTEGEKKSSAFETKVLEQLVFQQEVLAKIADRIFLVERMLFPAPVKLSTQMPVVGVE